MALTDQEAADKVRAAVFASARQAAWTPARPERIAAASRYNILIPVKGARALAYNSMSGAFAVWDEADLALYDRVERGEIEVGAAELQPFLPGGYVVARDSDELDELRRRYEAARFDPTRMVLTIAPTLGCNFSCSYCFQGLDKPWNRIGGHVKDALYAFLEQKTKEMGSLHVAWYGGEPLMDKKSIWDMSERIIDICKRNDCAYSSFIVTNGYFLDVETAKRLYDYKVTTGQVTLDGPAEYHDGRRHLLSKKPTYERIVQNLQDVVASVPITISIRVNVDAQNKDDIKELMDDLAARGLGGKKTLAVYFAPVEAITKECHSCNDETMSKVEYGRLEAELYRYAFEKGLSALPKPPMFHGNCQAVRPNGYLLAPNGDLHKCWDTVMIPDMKVGDIFNPEAVAAHPLQKAWVKWSPFDNATCRACPILPVCAGACAYKFIHADRTLGEGGALPCPSWKFNMAERLFLRAEKMGLVKREDWCDGEVTQQATTGRRHTFDSMVEARFVVSA